MQQIRITSTGKVREALNTLRDNQYPLLSDAEIIKVVLSQAVTGRIAEKYLFVEKLNGEMSKSLEKSREQIKKGRYQIARNAKELLKKLEE